MLKNSKKMFLLQTCKIMNYPVAETVGCINLKSVGAYCNTPLLWIPDWAGMTLKGS